MGGRQHQQAHRAGARLVEGQQAVGGRAREQGASLAATKGQAGEGSRRQEARQPKPGEQPGMTRRSRRPHDHREQLRRVLRNRLHEPPISASVLTQPRRRLRHGSREEERCAVVEGMRERRGRRDQVQLERREEGSQRWERHDRGADVVAKAGLEELFGPQPSTRLGGPFQHQDRLSGRCQRDRGGEAVRPGADDHGVIPVPHLSS